MLIKHLLKAPLLFSKYPAFNCLAVSRLHPVAPQSLEKSLKSLQHNLSGGGKDNTFIPLVFFICYSRYYSI
jgi:hypothetical protein